jgi:hypothetical protein
MHAKFEQRKMLARSPADNSALSFGLGRGESGRTGRLIIKNAATAASARNTPIEYRKPLQFIWDSTIGKADNHLLPAAGPSAPQRFKGEVFKAFTQLVRSLINVGDDHSYGLFNGYSVGGAYSEVSLREVKDRCDRAEAVPLPNIVFILAS